MKTRQQIYDGVRDILCERLALEPGEISEEKRLFHDLGAESIDYIDICFCLSRRFLILEKPSSTFPTMWGGFNESRYWIGEGVSPQRCTPEGTTILTAAYPHVDWNGFATNPTVDAISQRETVGSLVNYVARALSVDR